MQANIMTQIGTFRLLGLSKCKPIYKVIATDIADKLTDKTARILADRYTENRNKSPAESVSTGEVANGSALPPTATVLLGAFPRHSPYSTNNKMGGNNGL